MRTCTIANARHHPLYTRFIRTIIVQFSLSSSQPPLQCGKESRRCRCQWLTDCCHCNVNEMQSCVDVEQASRNERKLSDCCDYEWRVSSNGEFVSAFDLYIQPSQRQIKMTIIARARSAGAVELNTCCVSQHKCVRACAGPRVNQYSAIREIIWKLEINIKKLLQSILAFTRSNSNVHYLLNKSNKWHTHSHSRDEWITNNVLCTIAMLLSRSLSHAIRRHLLLSLYSFDYRAKNK